MKIVVYAKSSSKEEKIERMTFPSFINWRDEKSEMIIYKISVKESPLRRKANEAIMKLLAHFLNISLTRIHLLSGFRSRRKIFEIKD